MTRRFVVIKRFKDLEDSNRVYRGGDFYPREGIELDEARANDLASSYNKRGEPLIVEVVTKKESTVEQEKIEVDTDEKSEEYPVHTGGGYYELSNGDKVQGKDKAIEAEQKLKE